MQKRTARGVSLILVLVLLAAVGGTAHQGTASITKPDAEALNATDEILKSVSRLRGLTIKGPVKSGFKTRDQIEQAVIRDLDESTTPEEFEATAKTLTKLGLIPERFQLRDYVVRLLREQVAGFYEPRSREFYLAAWLPIAEQKTVMAHELTHALQDQHFDLRRFEQWPKGDSDAELAAHALIEGEATVVMFQYAAEQEGSRLDVTRMGSLTAVLLQQGAAEDSNKYPVLSRAPEVVRESLQFPYVYGVGFVQEVLKNRSWQALDLSYDDLPASTEQIIHPQRFLTRDNPVKIELASLTPALGRDWKQVDTDINGEFGYGILLSEFIPRSEAQNAAAGWGGDRYSLYENRSTGSLLIAQYTTWDSESDAREFFDAYCDRTEKRYKLSRSAHTSLGPRAYQTGEGLAGIELRNRDVAIIEGALTREQLTRLFGLLWKSKKGG